MARSIGSFAFVGLAGLIPLVAQAQTGFSVLAQQMPLVNFNGMEVPLIVAFLSIALVTLWRKHTQQQDRIVSLALAVDPSRLEQVLALEFVSKVSAQQVRAMVGGSPAT